MPNSLMPEHEQHSFYGQIDTEKGILEDNFKLLKKKIVKNLIIFHVLDA